MPFFVSALLLLLIAAPLSGQTEVDRKIIDMADRIEERVAAIRGLAFKLPVDKGIYNRDQLKEFLLKNINEELPEEKVEGWEAALKIFGLLPPDADLKETFVGFLTSQVGGFYDPEEKRLNCITTNLAFLQHMVMAHEILHSLQDQYVNLVGYYEDVEFNDDLVGARQAVIEGEAQHLTTCYARKHSFEMAGDMADAEAGDLSLFMLEQYASMQSAPPYFMEVMTFPYVTGEQFIKAAVREGGWPMVSALYKEPPRSTEQIIHPEKFFNEVDDPVKVVLPPMEGVLGERYEKIMENTMGEMQVQVLVKLTADPIRAIRAAPGWDGDTYAVFKCRESGRCFMIWALTFDSEKDAAEFFDAEKKGLCKKYEARGGERLTTLKTTFRPPLAGSVTSSSFRAGDGSLALLEHHGMDVIVLDNFPGDRDLVNKARDALWGFTRSEFDFEKYKPRPYGAEETRKRDGPY